MSELNEQIDKGEIREKFDDLYPKFQKLGGKITEIIEHGLKNMCEKLDYFSVQFRVKNFESFLKKILKEKCFRNPFEGINDILGVRVITYYKSDRERVKALIQDEFELVNQDENNRLSLSLEEFRYQAIHCDVRLNEIRRNLPECNDYKDLCAEIQICTINQHVWNKIYHEIGYKSAALPDELQRRLIYLNSLLETADREFDSIREEYDDLAKQIKKVDNLEIISAQIFNEVLQNESILIALLYSFWHEKKFQLILDLTEKSLRVYPNNSTILNFRGNAFLNMKQYQEAMKCVDKVLELDPNSKTARSNRLSIVFHKAEIQGDSMDQNGFPVINHITNIINSKLNQIISASEHQNRASFNRVFKTILKYAAFNLKFIEFPNNSFDEKDFQRMISQWVFHEFGRKCDEQVKTGRGFVDLRIDSIPIELKIDKDECNSLKLINKHLSQACAYTNSERQRAGILAILSLMRSNLPDPNLINDVLIKTCQTKGSPSKPEKYPTVILTIIFRGNQKPPSRLNS